MSTERYRHNTRAMFNLHYHLVWCPKYRKPVLVEPVATALKQLLTEKAQSLEVEIEAMEVMPDYVHIFVSAPPTLAPVQLANQFKGYTSRMLRQQFGHLRSRLPSLWSRSYYIGSIGVAEEETVRRYIEQQKTRSPR